MAQTINQAREKILTSIHGRRVGIDHTERLTGFKGTRKAVTAATSDTTGTVMPNHGFISVKTSTNDTWNIAAPEAGCEVTITFTGTTASSGIATITPASGTIQSSGTSTGASLTLTGNGASATLVGLSTSVYLLTATRGSTTTVFVTT